MSYYNSSSLQRYSSSARMSRDDYGGGGGTTSSSRDPLFDDIPDYGSAFVCGKSRFEEGKFHVRDDPILEIACGDEHTGVVTEKGRAFMFGSNNFGQLGLGHSDNVDKPSCVKSIKPDKVRLIACGRYHTLLTTEKGHIYSFGSNSDGQLGLGNDAGESFYNSPQRVKTEQDDWVMIAAGSSQSFALSKSGDLYAWGGNEYGELGLGRVTEQHYPKRVPLDFKVSFVACGYYHTAIISKSGKLYTCGSNDHYELGHNDDPRRFNEVFGINEPVTFVSCGGHHTVAIGYSGYKVYAFGDGTKGQLGLGEDMQRVKRPEVIRSLYVDNSTRITAVSCGECHTAFVNDRGQIFTCGDNRHGKLGHNQRVYNSIVFQPMVVEKFRRILVNNVACGGCHMILIGKLNTNFREKLDDLSDDSVREKGYSDRRSAREYSGRRSARRDSGTDDDMERTFNRTHTLTRDNKFVPLSELNLKKAAADERLRSSARYSKYSDDESDPAYKNKSYLKPTSSRYNTRNNESSEDDRYGNRSSRNNSVAPSMSVTPYVSPFAKDDRYRNVKTLSRSNLRTLSDESTDDDRYRRSRATSASGAKNQRRGTRTLSPKDLPKKDEKKKSRFCTVL